MASIFVSGIPIPVSDTEIVTSGPSWAAETSTVREQGATRHVIDDSAERRLLDQRAGDSGDVEHAIENAWRRHVDAAGGGDSGAGPCGCAVVGNNVIPFRSSLPQPTTWPRSAAAIDLTTTQYMV